MYKGRKGDSMNRTTLIKKMISPMWVAHIIIDSVLVIGYYVYIHPPGPGTSLAIMSVEFPIVLGAADIITHYVLGYD